MKRTATIFASLCLLVASGTLLAAPRAWLQSSRIALGETTTLNVESDSATAGAPDFSALQNDFDLRGQSSSTQMSIVNGRAGARSTYSVVLEPRAAGVFTIPSLTMGGGTTEPISLTVVPATPGSAQRGDPIYFESELSTHDPYVQQAVTYTVRLYYAVSLVDGGVDVRAPDNGSLEQIGEDRTSERNIGGQLYNMLERRYLLTAEKSGPMSLPAPRFRGRARRSGGIGFFSDVVAVSQVGRAESLNVRPQPAGAPRPWLVANQLTLMRGDVAHEVRAGEPLILELTLTAEGARASQLPDLSLPGIPGAQVFPEPQQARDAIVDGQPLANVTRRFAVVAAHPGTLRLPEVRVNYWNATSDRADAESLPALAIDVTPGAGIPASPIVPTPGVQVTETRNAGAVANSGPPADARTLHLWQTLTAVLALAFALALGWGWRRGRGPGPVQVELHESGAEAVASAPKALQLALAGGDLRVISDALRRTTSPPCPTVGALKSRLDDPAQRAAIEALESSLWGAGRDGGPDEETCAQLRQAFRQGPRFAPAGSAVSNGVLPPLYPQRS